MQFISNGKNANTILIIVTVMTFLVYWDRCNSMSVTMWKLRLREFNFAHVHLNTCRLT